MPLPFSTFTKLLQDLEKIELRNPPLPSDHKAAVLREQTELWFKKYRHTIDGLDAKASTALLSSLLPERRTDRVYGLQAKSLCRILCRTLGLSATRASDLRAYEQPSRGDLGKCLERVLGAGGPPARPAVTLEEVDEMLEALAGQCHFSDKSITISFTPSSSEPKVRLIGNIVKRLEPEEGKWLVRLMLKDFAPVKIHEHGVLRLFHFLLPDLLRFQSSFRAAVHLLKDEPLLRQLPNRPDPRSERLHRQSAALAIRPVVGIKVGRREMIKARSMKSCMKLLGSQEWVVERKYDGEYCEIHIDRTRSARPAECIQIFSKSGKDSTADKKGLHQTLVDCLRLDEEDCKIEKQAILLGELVVYSDATKSVLPFDKIRKHVSRSGVFLGTDQDSQAHAHEHLAIIFFDILLLDDEVVMTKPVDERRQWLREVYRKIPGRAMSAEWKTINFAEPVRAEQRLMEQFAAANAQRCEGLILKPCGVPYFSLDHAPSETCRSYIKLKKDYIDGMGDEADFAVIGASYNAQQALKSGLPGLKWTDFHLGCMINQADVKRFDAKPVFKIVATIQQEACIPKPILQSLNTLGTHTASPYGDAFEHFVLQETKTKIDVLFKTSFVLEVLGSGFDKPANCGFYMLRHPRVKKLHQDRSWKDCISYEALKKNAELARSIPPTPEAELKETRRSMGQMQKKLERRLERQGTVTPASRRSTPRHVREAATACLTGTALVGQRSSSTKRASPTDGDTPCPEINRRRSSSTARSSDSATSIVPRASGQPCKTPLSDITNQALGQNVAPHNIQAPAQTVPGKQPCKVATIAVTDAAYIGTGCPFNDSAVFLAPCIANALYITEDLLPSHKVMITADINHWDRDSFAHLALAEIVAESQACEGMRKIVLVESKRPHAVEQVIQEVVSLNEGRLRERVEIYDWRVLDECIRHDKPADVLKRHFIGATMFVEAEDRAIFVSRNIPGFGHSV